MKRAQASNSPLSVRRAFVVQFRDGTDVGAGRVAGRVEHVASRETAPFRSWTELRAFIARVLAPGEAKPPEPSE